MPRIQAIDHAAAKGDAKALLDGVKAGIGMVPNIFATMVQAPKVLEGFLAFNQSLGQGRLSPQLREQIALAVAGVNACDYCASAHTALGKGAGLKADELIRNLHGKASDPKAQAALTFARKVVFQRAKIDDADLTALHHAGFDEGEVVEIIAHIGVNLFTNYFNHIAETDIDFPPVHVDAQAQAA